MLFNYKVYFKLGNRHYNYDFNTDKISYKYKFLQIQTTKEQKPNKIN